MRAGALAVFIGLWIALLTPGEAAAGCVIGVSPGKELNLRAGPSRRYRIVGGIPAGACGVEVGTRCRANWCRVAFGNLRGWASMKFLDRDPVPPVAAATAPPPALEWELLGARIVGLARDRDIVPVGRREGRFKAIQLRVMSNDIFLNDLKVVYGNGTIDDIPVRRLIRAGQTSGPLDLIGRSRVIKEIRLRYRSRPNSQGRAEVQVYGLQRTAADTSTAAPPPAPPVEPAPVVQSGQWELLGSQDVRFTVDRDIVRVGRREGRYRAIQLAVNGNDVFLNDLKVVFGNGSVLDVSVRTLIRAGERSRPINIGTRGRFVREIQLLYRSRLNFAGTARVDVYGLAAGTP